MLSLSVLKLSMSRKNTPTRSPETRARFERLVERAEQLPAVGDAGERILLRELLQLARALLDLGFETLLRIARGGARHRELLRHRIECDGQRVELADAAARHDARVLAARQPIGGGQQPPHRPHDAEDGREAQIDSSTSSTTALTHATSERSGPASATGADAGVVFLPRIRLRAAPRERVPATAPRACATRARKRRRPPGGAPRSGTAPRAWSSVPARRRSSRDTTRHPANGAAPPRDRAVWPRGCVPHRRADPCPARARRMIPRAANAARTASRCARTSSSGSRAATRLEDLPGSARSRS